MIKKIKNFLENLETQSHTTKLLTLNTNMLHAIVTDSQFENYIYYLDLNNYPVSINISTMKNDIKNKYHCVAFIKRNLDDFNWNLERSRAFFNEIFNIDV